MFHAKQEGEHAMATTIPDGTGAPAADPAPEPSLREDIDAAFAQHATEEPSATPPAGDRPGGPQGARAAGPRPPAPQPGGPGGPCGPGSARRAGTQGTRLMDPGGAREV